MSRYIDADAIPYREIWREDWLNNAGKYQQGVFRDEIEEMPTVDAVPVIRCKDCKNSDPWYADERRCFLWSENGISVFDDGFCNYAERKEE